MNLNTFKDYFQHGSADIEVLDEQVIQVGDYWDFFYAFCPIGEELFSCNGKLPVFPYYLLGQPEFLNDQIISNRYARREEAFAVVERRSLGRGGDPRVVSNGRQAYAISILVVEGPDGKRNLGANLHNLVTGHTVPIKTNDPTFTYGKNWQPYLEGDDLYVVHELTPFRVLRIDTNTGWAEIVREHDISFKLPCAHTNYPMFRGGGNALSMNGVLLGVGRATSQRYRHHPFLWSFEDNQLQILFAEFFYPFHQCGYNIIDPTSLFFDGDDLLLGLCCSERDWAHTQLVSNFLLRLHPPGQQSQSRPLAEFFEERAISEKRGKPNLDRHMFFCIEMPSALPGAIEFGGRASEGKQGHLVHGPYVTVEIEGHYCAELSYLTKSHQSEGVGNFDITISTLDSKGNQVGFQTLGRVDLTATNGSMREARIEFDTTGQLGGLLELRVFVEEGVELNAFHIRTWRVDDTPDTVVSPFSYLQGKA